MGRLRNFSESFKAATFQNQNNNLHSSPTVINNDRSNPRTDVIAPITSLTFPNKNPSFVAPQSTSPRPGPSSSRPTSELYTSPVNVMGRDHGTIEELVPVFSFLSSHSNKLYQEGYFLKLNDLDINGKVHPDQNWTECFAQLVGTILSLWDASALDAAGQDGEVPPSFINLADASIKMIETLPTRNPNVQPLQNVLSISTAGNNRYLFHFNSLHSLTQWTAGIRLAMFEHASLQELYTGSLIAGKGKQLNNIRAIMERNRFKTEDWVRVRFGAGTPWRRCWCVIEPPDEKEYEKHQKANKKRSTYDRAIQPKGNIKFYYTKKTKKVVPLATITDAYSAYAIYPQSKPLIDQSTLVKVEGRITIHSKPESQTEGFVFVMPELHPAVSGFEMMLRWLFPVYDTFNMYGRPNRLIADTLDQRGLMFAMPRERKYGYLDIIDVAALIHTDGSETWSEREWRKQMKDFTSKRILAKSQTRVSGDMRRPAATLPTRNGIRYDDAVSVKSGLSRHKANQSSDAVFALPNQTRPTPGTIPLGDMRHNRSVSESVMVSPNKNRRQHLPSRLSSDQSGHRPILKPTSSNEIEVTSSAASSEGELPLPVEEVRKEMSSLNPPAPVATPPVFKRQTSDRPVNRPKSQNSMRYEQNRMSTATLAQMADVGRTANGAAMVAWKNDRSQPGVNVYPPAVVIPTNDFTQEVVVRSRSNSIPRKPLPENSLAPPVPSHDNTSVYSASIYDVESDESPDYASRKSEETQKSVTKPRGGVLKTVGGVGPANDIPVVDFGVTKSLTPARSPVESPGRKTPLRTPDLTPQNSRPTSYIWQPGVNVGRQSPGEITPEEFVQQRSARSPGAYVPQRSTSGQIQTPKKLQKKPTHSRPNSRNDVLQDFTPHMSAREQEHIARMTGGPLVNVPPRSKTPDPTVGLVGTIEAREQDRRNMHQGISSQLAQATIAQRQAQAQAQYEAQQYAAQQQYVIQRQQYGYGPGPTYNEGWHQQGTYPQNQQAYHYQQQQHQHQQYYQQQQQQQQQRYSEYYGQPEAYGRR